MAAVESGSAVERKAAELALALEGKYPDLRVVVGEKMVILRGSFPVMSEGEVLDRYQIEIEVPLKDDVPILREVGGRIPRIDKHHLNTDGTACPLVPEEWLLRSAHKRTVLDFLDGPVRNYFLGQSLVERGFPWPFGERPHGKLGLVAAYMDILELQQPELVDKFLECLSHKKIKGEWQCPCGSGRQLRGCHMGEFRRLQARIPHKIALSALVRLRGTA